MIKFLSYKCLKVYFNIFNIIFKKLSDELMLVFGIAPKFAQIKYSKIIILESNKDLLYLNQFTSFTKL